MRFDVYGDHIGAALKTPGKPAGTAVFSTRELHHTGSEEKNVSDMDPKRVRRLLLIVFTVWGEKLHRLRGEGI